MEEEKGQKEHPPDFEGKDRINRVTEDHMSATIREKWIQGGGRNRKRVSGCWGTSLYHRPIPTTEFSG